MISSSAVIVIKKRQDLLDFSRKIAERTVTIYPVRASILDCNGVKVAWTEWQFYFRFVPKQAASAEKLCNELGIIFAPENVSDKKYLQQNIPAEKTAAAVKLVRKYKFRLRKVSVRRYNRLSAAAEYFIGRTVEHCGISGIEAEYNNILQGQPGIYRIMRGPSGKIAKNSFKVVSPMRVGSDLRLKSSLLELQCGIFSKEVMQ